MARAPARPVAALEACPGVCRLPRAAPPLVAQRLPRGRLLVCAARKGGKSEEEGHGPSERELDTQVGKLTQGQACRPWRRGRRAHCCGVRLRPLAPMHRAVPERGQAVWGKLSAACVSACTLGTRGFACYALVNPHLPVHGQPLFAHTWRQSCAAGQASQQQALLQTGLSQC